MLSTHAGLFGMGYENGPFIITANGSLVPNSFSWNKFATMVYFEQPAGVGFSFSSNANDYNNYDDDISQTDNYAFLSAFFKQYPQYQNNPLWLTSESYGGNYVPQLARQVLQGPDTALAAQLKKGGITVGNPVFSTDTATFEDIISLVQADILYGHATLPLSFINQYDAAGCNSLNPPAACNNLFNEMFTLAGECFAVNQCGDDLYADPTGNATLGPLVVSGGSDRDALWSAYLGRADVQAAINALPPPLGPWSDCANINYDVTWPSNLPDYAALFENNVKVLIFSGDVDVATCPFAGTQYAIQSLNRTVVQGWTGWTVNTAGGALQQAGYVEQYDTFTFATVKAAGHEAPGFQPLAAYTLIEGFITGAGVAEVAPVKFVGVRAAPAKRTQGSILRELVQQGGRSRRA
jgi:carboxypeptidase C (cathepsin A)